MRPGATVPLLGLISVVSPVAAAAAGPLTLAVERAFVGDAVGTSDPVLDLKLAPQSARDFGDLTAANIGKVVELRIDGRVVLAPVVREAIRTGDVEVAGGLTRLELLETANRIWRGTAVVDVAPRD